MCAGMRHVTVRVALRACVVYMWASCGVCVPVHVCPVLVCWAPRVCWCARLLACYVAASWLTSGMSAYIMKKERCICTHTARDATHAGPATTNHSTCHHQHPRAVARLQHFFDRPCFVVDSTHINTHNAHPRLVPHVSHALSTSRTLLSPHSQHSLLILTLIVAAYIQCTQHAQGYGIGKQGERTDEIRRGGK